MPSFSFDKVNRIIEVAAPDTGVTVQQLINAIRDWEDELLNFDMPKVADASGKEDLGGGVKVGITLKLLNWKVKFEDRGNPPIVCTIYGGNLVAVDSNGNPMSPITPSENVTVMLTQSSSATMLQDIDIDAIRAKTDLLPSDVASEAALATAHGIGSWEGATPIQLWDHDDRKLTSRDIESLEPGEYLPSETQVEDIKKKIDEIKVGRGFKI